MGPNMVRALAFMAPAQASALFAGLKPDGQGEFCTVLSQAIGVGEQANPPSLRALANGADTFAHVPSGQQRPMRASVTQLLERADPADWHSAVTRYLAGGQSVLTSTPPDAPLLDASVDEIFKASDLRTYQPDSIIRAFGGVDKINEALHFSKEECPFYGKKLSARQVCALAREGVDCFVGVDLAGEYFENPIFSATFSHANMRGVVVHHGDLGGSLFEEADLTGSEFINTTLTGANFNKAELTGALMRGIDAVYASFIGAKLEQAVLLDACLAQADFEKANLTEAVLIGAQMPQARLVNADLTDAVLSQANLEHANLEGALLVGAQARGTNFEHAHLKWVDLFCADLMGANLKYTTFTNVYLTSTDLSDVDLTGADIGGTDFTTAIVADAIFAGVRLTWQNIFGYDILDSNGRVDVDPGTKVVTVMSLLCRLLSGADLSAAILPPEDLRGIKIP